jgi:hypothetical protein
LFALQSRWKEGGSPDENVSNGLCVARYVVTALLTASLQLLFPPTWLQVVALFFALYGVGSLNASVLVTLMQGEAALV